MPYLPQPPHLSEILDLKPQHDNLCIGYAHSKGRRCRLPTNATYRRRAEFLLDEGTRLLSQGRCLDELLDELAPLVLCTRWHQNQAGQFAAVWRGRVREVQLERAMASASMSISGSGSGASQLGSVSVSAGLPASNESNHPRTGHNQSSPSPRVRSGSTPVCAGQPNADTRVNLAANLDTPSRARRPVAELPSLPALSHGPSSTSSTPSTPSTPSDPPEYRPTSVSPTPQATAQRSSDHSISTPRPRLEDANPSTDRESRSTPATPPTRSPNRDRPVTRKPIEADCGICLCAMYAPEEDNSSEPLLLHASRNGEQNNQGQRTGNNVPSQSGGEEEDDSSDENLVWCRAQCGVNFHQRCMDQWIGRVDCPATCPNCRAVWVQTLA